MQRVGQNDVLNSDLAEAAGNHGGRNTAHPEHDWRMEHSTIGGGEVPDPSLPQHPFVIGEHKQVDEVRTLRLDEAGEVPSSSSSSSSSSVSPKEKLAKSCLKPWRSPVEAYLGKSFIFPQRRGSARASELLGASMHKSGSQKTAERTVAPVAQEEEAEVTATSHSAWEKIKRTHGFAALCHAHPRNDR
eukprot:s864_g5.t3